MEEIIFIIILRLKIYIVYRKYIFFNFIEIKNYINFLV